MVAMFNADSTVLDTIDCRARRCRKTSGRAGGRPVHFIVIGDDLAIITESRITVVDLKCRLPDDMTPKAEAGLEAIAEHA